MNRRSRFLVLGAALFLSLTLAEGVFTLAGEQARSAETAPGAALICDMQQYKAATRTHGDGTGWRR